MTKKHNKQDDTNYSFLLKCMAALTAAAVVAAGIIAAVTLNSAAMGTTALAAKMMFSSAFVFTPIIPIALIVIGLFLLPALFGCGGNSYATVSTNPGYRYNSFGGYGFYSSPGYTHHHDSSSVYTQDSHVHGHSVPGTVHGHDVGNVHGHTTGTVHGHDGGNVHGHVGGFVHGHR